MSEPVGYSAWGGPPSLLAAILAALVSGCGSCSEEPLPRGPAITLERHVLELDADGLSGLTADGDGNLWAVAEEDHVLVMIADDAVQRVVPLDGVPAELDVEAITWLEGRRFAIGTESVDADRDSDLVFVLEVSEEAAEVVETITMRYADIGAEPDDNDGIEGICAAGSTLVVAVERPDEVDGERHARLGVRRPQGAWSGRGLRLTSDIGKISALDCRETDDGVEVWAIERGLSRSVFGDTWVARVLRFMLPQDDETVAEPQIVASLEGRAEDQPNPEGLTSAGEQLRIIVDNHYRVRVGDNELLRVTLP